MLRKGVPEQRAEICLPHAEDLLSMTDEESSGPVQSVCKGEPKPRDDKHTTDEPHRLVPDRQVIGYVNYGRYSFTCGYGLGLGFVSVSDILSASINVAYKMMKDGRRGVLCLIRSVNSRQYRFAVLEIASDWSLS